ncbi:MAG: SDR family oxidoreductase, partial [Actinomycetota bacterium]
MTEPAPLDVGPEGMLLTDRVAVVTGAAQGIGEAVAVALARFGADVAICDRDEAGLADTVDEVEHAGRGALAGVLDVRDHEAVTRWLEEVDDRHGRVDILVNNAGGGFHSPFLDVSPKGQTALVDENFTSVTHFVRGCVPLMGERGGSIVNITSIEAHRAGPGFAVYSAMKAAVENLSRSLAVELAERRIRVNCISPDMIPTPGDDGLSLEAAAD